MNTTTKVVFPPPPPTTNELTAQQRTQLVRTTRKIEQLLGTSPRLIDAALRSTSPIRVTLPYGLSQRRLTKSRRSSVDSTSSYCTHGSMPSRKYVQRSSSLSSNSSAIRSRMPGCLCSAPSVKSIAFEGWVHDNTAPLLRLARESPTLETIPASPDPTQTSFADTAPRPRSHSRPDSIEGTPSSAFALTPNEVSSPRNSLVVSPLTIPSPNSLRKQKMDRLRKKLGSGVPLDLVFPKENVTERSENNLPSLSPANVDVNKDCPPLPPPPPRLTKKATRRISHSRDSISDVATIHRARRQGYTPSAVKLTHKKSRSAPSPAPPALSHGEFKRVKEKLSFIIESPDEHGSSCSEEFGLSRASTNDTDLRFVGSHHTEIKFWSTRKGYKGWNPVYARSLTSLHSIPTFTLSSSDDEGSDIDPAESPASRSNSPVSPVSVETLPTTETKKRPSSYRKPPPSVTAECSESIVT